MEVGLGIDIICVTKERRDTENNQNFSPQIQTESICLEIKIYIYSI